MPVPSAVRDELTHRRGQDQSGLGITDLQSRGPVPARPYAKAKKVLQDTSLAASSSQAKHETWLWPKPQLTPSSKGGGDVTSAASCFLGALPLPVPR